MNPDVRLATAEERKAFHDAVARFCSDADKAHDLAGKLPVSVSTVWRWVHGTSQPFFWMQKIVLGVIERLSTAMPK